jgi:ribosome biogenesis GTPase A
MVPRFHYFRHFPLASIKLREMSGANPSNIESNAIEVAVFGLPGSGKSTLINNLKTRGTS